jgi:hypothetical protein
LIGAKITFTERRHAKIDEGLPEDGTTEAAGRRRLHLERLVRGRLGHGFGHIHGRQCSKDSTSSHRRTERAKIQCPPFRTPPSIRCGARGMIFVAM